MAITIDTAFVEQFTSNVIHLSQQRGSRLRGTVFEEALTGEKHNFERLGAVEMQKVVSRHADTPILDSPHSRRVATSEDWEWGDLVDREDKVRMLISPDSEYAIAASNSAGRKIDDIIIDAALGDALAGDGSTVALPASQQVAVGGAGLTFDKVREAKRILDENEVDEMFPRTAAVSAQQLEDLLGIEEATSSDYNVVKSLVQGEIDTWLGFKWLRTQRLNKDGTDRQCIFYADRGIGLAVNQNPEVMIGPRPDKRWATQVYIAFTMGAVRTEEDMVVQVDCQES